MNVPLAVFGQAPILVFVSMAQMKGWCSWPRLGLGTHYPEDSSPVEPQSLRGEDASLHTDTQVVSGDFRFCGFSIHFYQVHLNLSLASLRYRYSAKL